MEYSPPDTKTVEAFRAWRADPSRWLPLATDIARSHSLDHQAMTPFSTGTNLVVALDHRLILKIFPPLFRNQFLSERTALSQLQGRVSVPIPELVLGGERDEWTYLVITRLHGVLGVKVWPALPETDKEIVLGQIGEAIAQVQAAPIGDLALLEPSWEQFIQRQCAGCRSRHIRLGMPQRFWAELDDIIELAPSIIPLNAPPVILTGEYIPENLLLSSHTGRWQLSGLFDFGDVMVGWREYDLLGPSAFMIQGMSGRLQSFLRGFGYSAADLNQALTRRLLTLMLLHRASDPLRHISINDWHNRVGSLAELAQILWPIHGDRPPQILE
jgi:hygromycin-B 7''-O-kinase